MQNLKLNHLTETQLKAFEHGETKKYQVKEDLKSYLVGKKEEEVGGKSLVKQ